MNLEKKDINAYIIIYLLKNFWNNKFTDKFLKQYIDSILYLGQIDTEWKINDNFIQYPPDMDIKFNYGNAFITIKEEHIKNYNEFENDIKSIYLSYEPNTKSMFITSIEKTLKCNILKKYIALAKTYNMPLKMLFAFSIIKYYVPTDAGTPLETQLGHIAEHFNDPWWYNLIISILHKHKDLQININIDDDIYKRQYSYIYQVIMSVVYDVNLNIIQNSMLHNLHCQYITLSDSGPNSTIVEILKEWSFMFYNEDLKEHPQFEKPNLPIKFLNPEILIKHKNDSWTDVDWDTCVNKAISTYRHQYYTPPYEYFEIMYNKKRNYIENQIKSLINKPIGLFVKDKDGIYVIEDNKYTQLKSELKSISLESKAQAQLLILHCEQYKINPFNLDFNMPFWDEEEFKSKSKQYIEKDIDEGLDNKSYSTAKYATNKQNRWKKLETSQFGSNFYKTSTRNITTKHGNKILYDSEDFKDYSTSIRILAKEYYNINPKDITYIGIQLFFDFVPFTIINFLHNGKKYKTFLTNLLNLLKSNDVNSAKNDILKQLKQIKSKIPGLNVLTSELQPTITNAILDDIVGNSDNIKTIKTKLYEIQRDTMFTNKKKQLIVIYGPTGVGKEIISGTISELNVRNSKTINCGSDLPKNVSDLALSFFGRQSKPSHNGWLTQYEDIILNEFQSLAGNTTFQSFFKNILDKKINKYETLDPNPKTEDYQHRFIIIINEDIFSDTKQWQSDLISRLNDSKRINITSFEQRQDDIEPMINNFFNNYNIDNTGINILMADKALWLMKHIILDWNNIINDKDVINGRLINSFVYELINYAIDKRVNEITDELIKQYMKEKNITINILKYEAIDVISNLLKQDKSDIKTQTLKDRYVKNNDINMRKLYFDCNKPIENIKSFIKSFTNNLIIHNRSKQITNKIWTQMQKQYQSKDELQLDIKHILKGKPQLSDKNIVKRLKDVKTDMDMDETDTDNTYIDINTEINNTIDNFILHLSQITEMDFEELESIFDNFNNFNIYSILKSYNINSLTNDTIQTILKSIINNISRSASWVKDAYVQRIDIPDLTQKLENIKDKILIKENINDIVLNILKQPKHMGLLDNEIIESVNIQFEANPIIDNIADLI